MIISLFIMCLMFDDNVFKKWEHCIRKHTSSLLLNLYRIKTFYIKTQSKLLAVGLPFLFLVGRLFNGVLSDCSNTFSR